jgi:hypothetical protein
MEIVTLKYSIMNGKIMSFKINDTEQEKQKTKHSYMTQFFDELFDTPKYSSLWKKICSTRVHVYFRYNVSNLNLRLKTFNIFDSNINNKTLLLNKFFNYDDTTLTIDILDVNKDTEINIIIKIIIPAECNGIFKSTYMKSTSINNHPYLKIFEEIHDGVLISTLIKLTKPNPMFKLVKVDDYDKKISSFKMSLYDISDKKYTKTNYEVVFDLYPTQTICYILILTKIINTLTNTTLNLFFDKDCIKCKNRITGCELNSISKVLLCCDCNQRIISNDISKFISNNINKCSIKINEFPSYIKDNFSHYHYIQLNY